MINLDDDGQNFDWCKIQKQGTQNVEVEIWDEIQKKFVKTQIQFTINQDFSVVHQQDGVILRKESFNKIKMHPNILKNMGQIKQLRWDVESDSKRNFEKWIGYWNGEALVEVGGYLKNGEKIGLWQEIIKEYWCQTLVYEKGEYIKDQQSGAWQYICNNNIIGGGLRNENGLKIGKWNELGDNFRQDSQVVYHGEYKNGKKVGLWETFYQGKQIGGGLYDQVNGVSIKTGKWCDLSEGFRDTSKVIYVGVYKNGEKVGKWDIKWMENKQQEIIGGGQYDVAGSIKIGKWIELTDGFEKDSQVSFHGEYNNGKKVGRWDIFFENELIGGGSFFKEGSTKIGKWIELSDRFGKFSQVTYNGQYSNGQKVGGWDILFREKDEFYKIGGGSYDKDYLTKIGKWIEINNSFSLYSQVTFNGFYKNGQKVGQWSIWNKDIRNGRNQEMQKFQTNKNVFRGEGIFDEETSIKIGRWTELSDGFNLLSQVTQVGEYKQGQKVGRWNIFYKVNQDDSFQLIGGGLYEKQSQIKIGRWIELSNEFSDWSQLIYIGEYLNGRKVGYWDIQYEGEKIGGGQYHENISIKIGSWAEPINQFFQNSQAIYKGAYNNGKKVGRWDILFRFNNNDSFAAIAGGSYDQGIKIGHWIELCDQFYNNSRITWNGEYKNNNKVGKWVQKNIDR